MSTSAVTVTGSTTSCCTAGHRDHAAGRTTSLAPSASTAARRTVPFRSAVTIPIIDLLAGDTPTGDSIICLVVKPLDLEALAQAKVRGAQRAGRYGARGDSVGLCAAGGRRSGCAARMAKRPGSARFVERLCGFDELPSRARNQRTGTLAGQDADSPSSRSQTGGRLDSARGRRAGRAPGRREKGQRLGPVRPAGCAGRMPCHRTDGRRHRLGRGRRTGDRELLPARPAATRGSGDAPARHVTTWTRWCPAAWSGCVLW